MIMTIRLTFLLFPVEVVDKEMACYLEKQTSDGLPLDSHADYIYPGGPDRLWEDITRKSWPTG
jgi:hypothetical protein